MTWNKIRNDEPQVNNKKQRLLYCQTNFHETSPRFVAFTNAALIFAHCVVPMNAKFFLKNAVLI